MSSHQRVLDTAARWSGVTVVGRMRSRPWSWWLRRPQLTTTGMPAKKHIQVPRQLLTSYWWLFLPKQNAMWPLFQILIPTGCTMSGRDRWWPRIHSRRPLLWPVLTPARFLSSSLHMKVKSLLTPRRCGALQTASMPPLGRTLAALRQPPAYRPNSHPSAWGQRAAVPPALRPKAP